MAAVCRIVDQIMGNLFSIEIRRHFLTKRKAQAPDIKYTSLEIKYCCPLRSFQLGSNIGLFM